MSQPHPERGLTRVQVLIGLVLGALVVGSAAAMLGASVDLAQSASLERTASMRVDHVLTSMADDVRRAALGATVHGDGSTFADGDKGDHLGVRLVESLTVTADGSAPVAFRLDGPVLPEGRDLVRVQGAETRTLAHGITAFSVRREGALLHLSVTAAAGPPDERSCTATGALAVLTRNP